MTSGLGTGAIQRRFPESLVINRHHQGFSMSTKHLVIGLGIAAALAVNAGASRANPNDAPGVRTLPAPDAPKVGSGMTSQPPDPGIAGNNPGSRGSTSGQGLSGERSSTVGQGPSGGKMGDGEYGSKGGSTGSGSPGTGAKQ